MDTTPFQERYYAQRQKVGPLPAGMIPRRVRTRLQSIASRRSTLRIGDPSSDYLVRYAALAGLYKHLFPYNLLEPTRHAVQVGSVRSFIKTEASQALILSTLFDRVTVLEAESRSVAALEEYLADQQVTTVDVREIAVFSHSGTLEFQESGHNPSTSALTETFPSLARARIHDKSAARVVNCDTLDSLFEDRPVDFVNLTINGAEEEALKGSDRLIRENPTLSISIPLIDPGHHLFDARMVAVERVHDAGPFNVVFGNAPHPSWSSSPFLNSLATRLGQDELEARGAQVIPDGQVREQLAALADS